MKAADILRALGADHPERGITELSDALGMQKTVTYNIAETLVREGLLEKDPVSRRYRVGMAMYELGQVYANRGNLQEAALLLLSQLRDLTGCTVHFGILDRGDILILLAVESNAPIRVTSMAGERRVSYGSALGKAILAELTTDEVTSVLPARLKAVTSGTIVSWNALKRDLVLAKQRGYSTQHGELVEGISSIGAAIRDREGMVVGGVSASFPMQSLPDAKAGPIVDAVQHTAAGLSAAVGPILRGMGDIARLRAQR
ncbi:MAG: IclR family transcriptional regulator [bacterium]|nr:IclR family transcriptional regulator [bacterium]